MKYAINDSAEIILAEASAPKKALCPSCKGVVILRMRRRSSKPGDVTYFWRHEDHTNPWCLARFWSMR
jgi:hypothetical protein